MRISYPTFLTIYGTGDGNGVGGCLTILVNHPQGMGDVSPRDSGVGCVSEGCGWLVRFLTKLVNDPKESGDGSLRE